MTFIGGGSFDVEGASAFGGAFLDLPTPAVTGAILARGRTGVEISVPPGSKRYVQHR